MLLLSTNITSPLGMTTDANYLAVRAGRTALAHHGKSLGVPFGFHAALFTEEQWHGIMLPGHTRFESLVLHSVRDALKHTDIDVASPRTVFILGTTKGDILTPPGLTARRIAQEVGVKTEPIVACNACISGVAAQVLALRLVESGCYDCAIVAGADVQGEFIIAGFHSLKALSPEQCRPFDAERLGLNLGEAAATMIYRRDDAGGNDMQQWHLVEGAIRNDAFHISGPHPKGEGCLRAVEQVMGNVEDLAVVGVHGTATMYNDQMESKAIERAGLSDVPLSALKGYYGHTMGAAGLLETIMTARALDDGIILPSIGYHERGVSGRVTISSEAMYTEKREFIKVISGFGGGNGAIRLTKHPGTVTALHTACAVAKRQHPAPRLYKMDRLSRLALSDTMALLDRQGITEAVTDSDNVAVILFNRTSSAVADRAFLATIADKSDYYPSPALFVHTLPNISVGEVALHLGLYGETSFYILPERDETLMQAVVKASFLDSGTETVIAGWIDLPDEASPVCELEIYRKEMA